MKYYCIAGEASGDMHGATLIAELKKQDAQAKIRFWGGDKMLSVDHNIVKHYNETSFMGFVEVAKNLPKILSFLKFCKSDILNFAPDVLILIDYPGFNLRIAKWASTIGIKVVYYISPQVWAWKASRIKQMKRDIDQLYVILPFEQSFFEEHQMPVKYFGHPLKKAIKQFQSSKSINSDIPENCIACLPGSRAQEIKNHMAYIVDLAKLYPEEEFVIAGTSHVSNDIYQKSSAQNIQIIKDRSYDIFERAKAGIISSGTATLEACLFKVPQVVIYKGNALSYQIAKRIVNLKYISLVNLIADKAVVQELIQDDLTIQNLSSGFKKILDEKNRKTMLDAYQSVELQIGNQNTSALIATDIISQFKS